jgi:ABC-type Fe3+ transport system permease subunit
MRARALLRVTAFLPAAILLIAFFGYPLLRLTSASLIDPETWSRVGRIFSESTFRDSLLNSIWLSALVALGGTGAALLPAWYLGRSRSRWTTVLRAVYVLPLSFSGVLVGFLALLMLGRVGFVPRVAQLLLGIPLLSGAAYQLTGLVAAYLYFEIPRATLALESTIRQFDDRLLIAARALGANAQQRFFWLILPILRPTLLSTFALTFVVSFGSFGVALILCHRFSVLPLEMFNRFVGFNDWPTTNAMALILLTVAFLVLWSASRYDDRARFSMRYGPAIQVQDRVRDRGLFNLLGLATLLLALVLGGPLILVVAGAFLDLSWLGVSTESWSASNLGGTLSDFWQIYHHAFAFSLCIAIACVGLALSIGLAASLAITHLPRSLQSICESFVLLPLSTPGVVLAIAIIQAYSVVRGNPLIILAGHLVYTLPFVIRLLIDSVRATELRKLEGCAATLCAGPMQRFWLVSFPLLRRPLVISALIVFAVSWGEFNISFLLNTPIYQTFPAALYATYTGNSFHYASLATVIFLAVLVPILFVLQRFGSERWLITTS